VLERTRNAVTRRSYLVLAEGTAEPHARYRRLRDAEREACVRAQRSRSGRPWLVVPLIRGERRDAIRRFYGADAGGGDESAGVREPRRPRGPLGAGSVALPLPD
jgi:hypothetical protein